MWRTPAGFERKAGRFGFWVGVGCGGLVVLAAIAAAVFYFLLTAESPEFQQVRQRVVARQAPAAPSSAGNVGQSGSAPAPATPPVGAPGARSPQPAGPAGGPASARIPPLDQQVRAIEQAVRRGYRGPVQVVVTEDEIARELQKALAQSGATDIGAKVTGDEILLSARVNFKGIKAPAVVHLRPELNDGGLRLVITRAVVGRFQLSQSQVSKLQEKLDRSLKFPATQAQGVRITNIMLQPGAVTVQAYVQPAR